MNEIITVEDEAELEIANDYDIDAFLAKRKEFITKVNAIMVEGKDYHVIQGKKSLAKGGAEKIASIFNWQASFGKDTEVADSFKLEGLIAFKATLTKQGVFVGEGRGAALLSKNGGDPNKTIKMSQKSAFIDSVLRASGLSDFFTQDLEDMPVGTVNPSTTQILKPKTILEYNQSNSRPAEIYKICPDHGETVVWREGGTSKTTGKPYSGFWACTEKTDGKFCKAKLIDKPNEIIFDKSGEEVPFLD